MSSSATASVALSPRVLDAFAPYVGGDDANRLNLGCANNPEPGFVNLDFDARTRADVFHDLETVPLPFAANTFDCILGSHVFEHIRNFLPLVAECYRLLKPGGYLISVTPYGSADGAWDSPHHVRGFSEHTWFYATQALYEEEAKPHAGFGAYQGQQYAPWRVERVVLTTFPEFVGDPDLEFKKKHWRNVIQEVHAVLRKATA